MRKVITRRETCVEIDEVEYEVRLEPESDHDVEHRKLEDGRMVIGYLLQDESCDNPLEDCDGMGKIHSHRSQRDADESSRIIGKDHMVIPLSKFEHSGVIWAVMGAIDHIPDFNWDGTRYAGRWEPDAACIEHIKATAISKLLPDGCNVEYKSSGEKLNVITLTLPDGKQIGGYASFAGAYRSAARRLNIKLTKAELIKAERLVAIDCANQACKTYTEWCNGECYGVVVVTCEADGSMIDSDECWGFIGLSYAEQEVRDRIAACSTK